MNVLFLCTGNSCRSVLAEATFNALAPAGMRAMERRQPADGSGSPAHAGFAGARGYIGRGGCHSKSWHNPSGHAGHRRHGCARPRPVAKTCPAYLGPALRTHWGSKHPARATGTDAEIDTAFVTAYRILRSRIEAFLALPLAQLQRDRARLKAEMDRIGTLVP